MKKGEVKYTYCVWNNKTDTVVAIDETAKRCAELMKIALNTFYMYINGKPCAKWEIIKTNELEGNEDD